MNDRRGIAPVGYHVPSEAEWIIMIDFLGGETVAMSKLKNTNGWGEGGNGSNSSGFSSLPSGARNDNGLVSHFADIGAWWSSTDDGPKDKFGANENAIVFLINCSNGVCLDDTRKGIGIPARILKN